MDRVQSIRRRTEACRVPNDGASIDRTRLTLICFVICFIYQFACMNMSVTLYDEGIMLVGAMRVADGDIPHRDFYANYGPGQFYVLAGLFKLFSPSVLIERIWDTVAKTISVAAVLLIVARATGSTLAALGTAFVCMIWFASFESYGYPIFPALAAALFSLLALASVFGLSRATWPLLAAGGSAGVAFLFRYDIGIFTFLVLGLVLGGCVVSRSWTTGKVLRNLVRPVALFSAGFAAFALPVVAAFAAYGAVGDLLFDIVVFPAKYYSQTRSLPFPNLQALADNPADIVVYMPLILIAGAVASMLSVGRRHWENTDLRLDRSATMTRCWLAVALVAMTLVYFGKGVVRVSPIHMAMAIITSLVLTGVTAATVLPRTAVSRVASFAALLLAAFCTTAALADNVKHARDNLLANLDGDFWATPVAGGQSPKTSCRVPIGLERLACFSVDRSHMDAIRFLQERTKPGDFIYVGLGRHDKIFMNDVAIYFLSKLRPATKWQQFDPGLQTSQIVQREMIGELQCNRPRFVVLESQWDSVHEPNASGLSSGVFILDDYIRDHFKVVARFDTVSVFVDAAL
jgi:hypothetical protein